MQTRPKHTMVILPNNDRMEVTYYCSDKKINEKDKDKLIHLIVQLHDCHCTYAVQKALVKNTNLLEHTVHNVVINAKGHLC